MNEPTAKVVSLRRSLILLTDSAASIKLIQHELLVSKRTYKDVAHVAQLASSTVSNIAIGHTKMPRMETVIRLLHALGWTISASRREE